GRRRGAPPGRPPPAGVALCRHVDLVALAERDLLALLPGQAGPATRVTLSIAVNSDSLATWFLPAICDHARAQGLLLNIAVDDEEHTADWLKAGRVLAAVTTLEKPVPGCNAVPLGALRYHATASPDFMALHFADGVRASTLAHAPALTFNQKDQLQQDWLRARFGRGGAGPVHWLPSTEGFVTAALAGLGWGMNPALLVAAHLQAGRLVELIPGAVLDRPLFWQINRRVAGHLEGVTRALRGYARGVLVG
ncbi:MAG: ArgP/LysG family DNA-binding transcriptional regulator, partial [Natronohydrobacter sp.]|nr:ArgP/LysG family DNA-binding transcriptional regulator [Natronohydrobacter sp.]